MTSLEKLIKEMETDSFWEMEAPVLQESKKKSKEEFFEEFLPFEEIFEKYEDFKDWSVKSKKLSYWRNCHGTFKKMWDGRKRPESMGKDETFIYTISLNFKNHGPAKRLMPLGNFKDLMVTEATHESIYYSLLEKFLEEQYTGESYVDFMIGYSEELFEEHFDDRWISWNKDAFYTGLSLMAYTSSIGILLEKEAHDDLNRWLQAFPKAAARFKYEPADADEWENKDVDGLFIDKKNGNVAVKVSIKTMGALTEDFIMNSYRRDSEKTAPQIYAGYTDMNEELSFIEVDGDLKQLLKDYLKGS